MLCIIMKKKKYNGLLKFLLVLSSTFIIFAIIFIKLSNIKFNGNNYAPIIIPHNNSI